MCERLGGSPTAQVGRRWVTERQPGSEGQRECHCSLHALPGGVWHVFVRLIQVIPQALPVVQTLQACGGRLLFASSGGSR